MKITLLNPPHTAIGSRMPREHLPPLGLLSIGGPLLDAGFTVNLIDAEFGPMTLGNIVQAVRKAQPDVVMIGHSGSSSVHVTVLGLCRAIKGAMANLTIVYGGVHPTYHWHEILRECPEIDIIVRGEGERTTLLLMQGQSLQTLDGIFTQRLIGGHRFTPRLKTGESFRQIPDVTGFCR